MQTLYELKIPSCREDRDKLRCPSDATLALLTVCNLPTLCALCNSLLPDEMVPEDVDALTDVHVTHHQLAEVFCLVVLMVLVRMAMAWWFTMK